MKTEQKFRGKDLTGAKFNRWTVLRLSRFVRNPSLPECRMPMWECRCDCGTIREVRTCHLVYGASKSCGCLREEVTGNRSRKHGESRSAFYRNWEHMKQRCLNASDRNFPNYGGRGITVCKRWLDYENFKEDMAPTYQSGLSLGRIDNDGPYSPENCRWETDSQQMNNTRRNVRLTAFGMTKTLSQWARHVGLDVVTLHWRINHGWSVEGALTIASR